MEEENQTNKRILDTDNSEVISNEPKPKRTKKIIQCILEKDVGITA